MVYNIDEREYIYIRPSVELPYETVCFWLRKPLLVHSDLECNQCNVSGH